MKRRDFLRLGGVLSAAAIVEATALASELPKPKKGVARGAYFTVPGTIWMKRIETGEEIAIQFRRPDGYFDPMAMNALSWFMRDEKAGKKAIWIDPKLVELLSFMQYGISASHGRPVTIQLNSGYRTKGRNAKIEGAAKNSLHIVGKAADVVFPGVSPELVGSVARYYNAGGIGFYPRFSHIDVGSKREWRG